MHCIPALSDSKIKCLFKLDGWLYCLWIQTYSSEYSLRIDSCSSTDMILTMIQKVLLAVQGLQFCFGVLRGLKEVLDVSKVNWWLQLQLRNLMLWFKSNSAALMRRIFVFLAAARLLFELTSLWLDTLSRFRRAKGEITIKPVKSCNRLYSRATKNSNGGLSVRQKDRLILDSKKTKLNYGWRRDIQLLGNRKTYSLNGEERSIGLKIRSRDRA